MSRVKRSWRGMLTLFTLLRLGFALGTGISIVELLQTRQLFAQNCSGSCTGWLDCNSGCSCSGSASNPGYCGISVGC